MTNNIPKPQAAESGHSLVPANCWIGIDVSKATLDVYLLTADGNSQAGSFGNEPSGFAKMLKWVNRLSADCVRHFCLEATGAYSEAVSLFLVDKQQRVSVMNPYRVHHAGISQGLINKTDKISAKLLAEFCRKEQPDPWKAALPHVRYLISLVRYLQVLKLEEQRNDNRLQEPNLVKPVRQSLEQIARVLSEQITDTEREISRHINDHPDLKADKDLLVTIPGISDTTAYSLMAELADISTFRTAKQAAAFAGLQPQLCQSGTSVHKRAHMSKRGNRHLRKALYMPAMAAIRFNPLINALAQRLTERGMKGKAVIGAAMRKLLMIAYGVLKSRVAFRSPVQNALLGGA